MPSQFWDARASEDLRFTTLKSVKAYALTKPAKARSKSRIIKFIYYLYFNRFYFDIV